MNKARYIRRKAHEKFAAIGKPVTCAPGILEIERAALRAGLSVDQAHALTCMAYSARMGYDWQLTDAHALRASTRARHADEHPQGKWAALRAAGHSIAYLTEDDARALWDAHVRAVHAAERGRVQHG